MGADAAEYWVDSHGNLRTTAFEIGGDRALRIKGASWFGLESSSCFIGGAARRVWGRIRPGGAARCGAGWVTECWEIEMGL